MADPRANLGSFTTVRGDAFELTVTVTQTASDGSVSPVDLTAYGSFTCQARSSQDALTAVDVSIDVSNAVSGVLVLSLTGSQTAGMSQPDSDGSIVYGFDVQADGSALSPDTPLEGSIVIVRDFTHG